VLRLVAPGCQIVTMAKPTAGALCSVLLGMEYLEHEDELLVANADQWIEAPIDGFLSAARASKWDGAIMTFPNTHPRWSYARLEHGLVVAVAEKQPISRNATAGLYYFRRGVDFVRGAERMLFKNASFSGEFYVAPVYNELILAGKRIGTFPIEASQMHGLGTPEEVERFQARTYATAS
jgi:dTDP-glucose pyrophosphorylase